MVSTKKQDSLREQSSSTCERASVGDLSFI